MNVNTVLNSLISSFYKTKDNRLSILMYHRTLKEPNEYHTLTCERLLNIHFRILSEQFNVLPLIQATELLYQDALPKNAVAITFDDGYADNATVALPILLKYNLTATFFILPGFFSGGMMFNDRVILALEYLPSGQYELTEGLDYKFSLFDKKSRLNEINIILSKIKHLPIEQREAIAVNLFKLLENKPLNNLMLTEDQARLLHRSGMTIGGHTMTHPILTSLSLPEAQQEINDCQNALSELLRSPIKTFAYPNGKPNIDYTEAHIEFLKESGYEIAVSTEKRVATSKSDIFQLPRYGPWQKRSAQFIYQIVQSRRF